MGGLVVQILLLMILGAAVTGILLNALLLVVLHKIKTTRTSYFALVKSLIVADMLLPLNITVIVITNELVLYEYLLYVILVHLILLVMEHYMAIIRPLHYVSWARCRYIICRLLMGWTLPVILVVISRSLPDKTINLKTKYFVDTELIKTKDIFRIPFILICFISIVVVNMYIYKAVRRQERLHGYSSQQSTHNSKVLVITIFNAGSFFICWFPVVIVEVWFQMNRYGSHTTSSEFYEIYEHRDIKFMMQFILLLNSIFDPLIYAIRLRVVRRMWQKLFCCLCKKPLSQRVKARQIAIHYCVAKDEKLHGGVTVKIGENRDTVTVHDRRKEFK